VGGWRGCSETGGDIERDGIHFDWGYVVYIISESEERKTDRTLTALLTVLS
jgi:hypothetical protein